MTGWKLLGEIILCQIHTDRMVRDGVYIDDLLSPADALWLSPDGVVGMVDGDAVLHGHHRLHPTRQVGTTQKHRDFLPHRLLSFGFTSHYGAMADRFGAAPLGCAAEDIIVDHDELVSLETVQAGVQIRRGDRTIDLVNPAVAKPCVPFTKFLLEDQGMADDKVAPHRAFLDGGMRGFIVGLANQIDPVEIVVGDELWIRA